MTIQVDILQTLGIAMLAYVLGVFIKNKFDFFKKFFIPSPVIGGLIISLGIFALKSSLAMDFEFDKILQDFFMNVFFASIGLCASFKSLRKAGLIGVKLAISIIILLPLQNIIGVGISLLLGINPLHGIAMGSTSMTGGIGSAISFGKIMETMGAVNNTSIGVAAATFGLLVGSLVGGPVAKRLIIKNKLKSSGLVENFSLEKAKHQISQASLMKAIVLVAFSCFLGTFINLILAKSSLSFPYYVGCQFGGLVIRNVYDFMKRDLDIENVNLVGNISLNLFLSLALINLNISAIISLAGPMFVILIAQAIFIAIYTSLVTYRLCGKDYDSAVMAAGHCGVGLGQTPNAMANMEAIIEERGPAELAMFVFPIVLAIAVNLMNPIVITFFINFFA
ncbi:sodium/glutamate symporter [Anaerococcus tetradius]|uniref:Sodium/glutamate symporter n=1 Tax=Anaerococcus tetradius TaxID=33036 RepID=A0A133KAU4_9FIRM|nr:sodium/glutamate symporter [Anaerococcus tetradius]KWZ76683.1 sodium/glutamate symporter [Anaerococcus tetradius]